MTDTPAGEALRTWRGERTQAWLAKQLGVTQTTVSRIETGTMIPGRAMALAIEHISDGAVKANAWPRADESVDNAAVRPDATGTGEA